MSELKDPKEFLGEPHIKPSQEEILENIRELLGAIFIQSQRNYDILCLLGGKDNPDVEALVQLHREGKIFAPSPSFLIEDLSEKGNLDG